MRECGGRRISASAMKSAAAVLVLFAFSLGCADCAKILAVVPTLSKSHYVMFEVLIKQLASRGHAVTAITTFPQENRVENLVDISLRPVRKVVLNSFEFGYFSRIPETVLEVAPKFLEYIAETEKVLNFTAVSDLINSNEHFDLIIYESFVDDVFLGFAHKFGAPVITVSTCFMFPWIADRFAIPANPAYVPGFYSGYSDRMGFLQRLQNCLHDVSGRLYFYLVLEPRSTRVLRKYFGPDTPPVRQLITNVSLYFVNSPFPLFGARSYPPQVVDISGVHLQDARPLPQVTSACMLTSPVGS